MMKRRDFVKLGLAGLIQPLLSGCDVSAAPARLVAQTWPGYEMFFAADQQGILNASLIDLIETNSASVSMRLLASGAVECACLTMDEVLTCRERGVDLVVIAVLDFSNGADAVMCSPEIVQMNELKGKRFGVESTATGAVMLQSFLQRHDLSPADIQISYLTVDEHEHALTNHDVDVLVTYEPVKSRLEKLGFTTLYDSSSNATQIFDVLAVSRSFLHSHREHFHHLLKSHFKALNLFLNKSPEIIKSLSNRMLLAEENVVDVYQGLKMVSLRENSDLFNGASPAILLRIESLAETMVSASLLNKVFVSKDIIDASFLNGLAL